MKNGITSTEFYVMAATLLLDAANAIGLHFSSVNTTAVILANVVAVVYGALRTWLKQKYPQVQLPDLPDSTVPDASATQPAPVVVTPPNTPPIVAPASAI